MLKLYDNHLSRNGYKVRLLLSHLGQPFEYAEVDIAKGGSRTPEFLAKNPAGRIPVLELDDGSMLPESNACLFYLAEGTPFLPHDRRGKSHVLRWMFFDQNAVEPNIGSAKLWKYMGWDIDRAEAFEAKVKGGLDAMEALERHLAHHMWLAAGTFTIADIAAYAYLHEAEKGGFALEAFPHVTAWLTRVASLPKHVPHTWTGPRAAASAGA